VLFLFKTFQNANHITGNMTSFLAKGADHVLNTTVEGLPYQSCSTSSTTAQLVMGDALAFV
jgi:arabinose-5-phosphate isomerase